MHGYSREYDKILKDILSRIKCKLNGEEVKILTYFIKHISVGEILALIDLRRLGIDDPEFHIRELISKGILERGEGCYNLAKELREEVFKIRRKLNIHF